MAIILTLALPAFAQQNQGHSIKGRVICDDMDVMGTAQVFIENTAISTIIDEEGDYELKGLKPGKYVVVAYAYEHETQKQEVEVNGAITVNFHLHEFEETLNEVEVIAQKTNGFGRTSLNAVDGMGIYEGKKTEVLVVDDIIANKATNNARQVFSRVSGLNIWESDCAGIQLGVGGRGLSPNRSSNFNVRQNGIDISADALGYPESYYAPPIQAVERIEIVRGAASLQYGTQFGGLLNFVMKDAPAHKPIEVESSLTYGSYNYFNAYNSIGGTKGDFSYQAFYQYRSGDCWRCNSEFDAHTGYIKLGYDVSKKLKIEADYTYMNYLAKQPGGLTDAQFEEDPQASYRDRNWFRVKWNLMSLQADYTLSPYTKINTRFFGLIATREALGNLTRIDRPDNPELERTLIDGDFRNIGNETRLLHRYFIGKQMSSFLLGVRLYNGNSINLEGMAPAGSKADFRYLNADSLNYDYDNGAYNVAVFAENIFPVTDKLSITPGARFEYIKTTSDGYFRKEMPRDLAGNPLLPDTVDLREFSSEGNTRSFVLLGMGISYKPGSAMELYANFSQNYKSISFSDIRVTTPTLVVDPDIQDESGYSVDLGARGTVQDFLSFEVTAFLLRYRDRIGALLQRDENFRVYRYRSNIGDATNTGVETFAEIDFFRWLRPGGQSSLSVFSNFTWLHTEYTSGPSYVVGNRVEFTPEINLRAGITYRWKNLGATTQFSYLSDQFSDASNAPNDPPVPGAVEGTIPAYYVADISVDYQVRKWLKASFSINNLTDHMYFTRRATGYPGPGIIPSDGRTFHFTLTGKF